jgi:hypothetical protein
VQTGALRRTICRRDRTGRERDVSFEVLSIVVILNVMATIALWRSSARKPAKLKKKFIAALRTDKPIVPNHRSPKAVGESIGLRDEDRQFFGDFEDFANVVNWWLADPHVGGPWRLQELPEMELMLSYSDMPDFGRRYAIFHNQVRLGELEISSGRHYDAENPVVRTNIQMNWVRLLSFATLSGFLYSIAEHVCGPDQTANETDPIAQGARSSIDAALTRVLWHTQQIDEFDISDADYGTLELQFNGFATDWYFRRRQALRDNAASTDLKNP